MPNSCCDKSLRSRKHSCVRHSQRVDPSGGWNPGVCSECQALFKAADSEPFRGNNKDILKELARRIAQKCKSATYPRRTIFLNEEVERKFRRSWFGKTISVTGTSKDLESVNPHASVTLPVPNPPTAQPLRIFYHSGPFLSTFIWRTTYLRPVLESPLTTGGPLDALFSSRF